MTIIVQMSLATGVDTSGTYFKLGHPDQGVLGTDVLGTGSDALIDYSGRVMALEVNRASSRRVGPLVEYSAGTATITLLNDDGYLDPATMDDVAPGTLITVHKAHAGVAYPVFHGYIDGWLPEQRAPDHAVVIITATDGLARLARFVRPAVAAVGAGETSGARVNRILNGISWTGGRDVSTGNTTVQATTLEGSALDELQRVAYTEAGELFYRPTGELVFRGRDDVLTDPRSVTSQATFGSDIANGEVMYVGSPGLSYDTTQLINRVHATRTGGTTQTTEDIGSIARYGEYVHTETELMHSTDVETQAWAAAVLHQDSAPEMRFTNLTVDTRINPDASMPLVLGLDMGDRVTVVRRAPGGVVESREVFIRSISHSWEPADRWVTNWGLQPAGRYQDFFILGSASRGVLGQNALSF